MTHRLAFLGPPGTFTEEAALRYAAAAKLNATLVSMTSITAVATAVESGTAEEGLVPIENSLEGPVAETLDFLVHSARPLMIRSEVVLPIEHFLLVRPGQRADEVRVILSKPEALGQCRAFLERCFPRATLQASLSTAAAVEEMMTREDAAAISTRRAGEIYGAEILAKDIQDRAHNLTRFVVLAPQDQPPTGDDKTSVAFAFSVEDRPGLLVTSLQEFSSRAINLSKIESRPSKERLGTYIFLVDVDGHRTDARLAEALARIEPQCSFFRVLGSYPRFRAA